PFVRLGHSSSPAQLPICELRLKTARSRSPCPIPKVPRGSSHDLVRRVWPALGRRQHVLGLRAAGGRVVPVPGLRGVHALLPRPGGGPRTPPPGGGAPRPGGGKGVCTPPPPPPVRKRPRTHGRRLATMGVTPRSRQPRAPVTEHAVPHVRPLPAEDPAARAP